MSISKSMQDFLEMTDEQKEALEKQFEDTKIASLKRIKERQAEYYGVPVGDNSPTLKLEDDADTL